MIRFLLLLLLLPGAELLSNHTDEPEDSSRVSLGAEAGAAGTLPPVAKNSSPPTAMNKVAVTPARVQRATNMPVTPSTEHGRRSKYRRTTTTKNVKKIAGPEIPGERVPTPDEASNASIGSTNFAAGTEVHWVEAGATATRKQMKVGSANPAAGIKPRKLEHFMSGVQPATQLVRPPSANVPVHGTSLKTLLIQNSSLLDNTLQPMARVFSNATSAKTSQEKENRTENSIFASQGKKPPLTNFARGVGDVYGRLRDASNAEDVPMTSRTSRDNDISRPPRFGGLDVPRDRTLTEPSSGTPDITLLNVSSPEPFRLEGTGLRLQSQLELNPYRQVSSSTETTSRVGLEIHSPTKVFTQQTHGQSALESSTKVRTQARTSAGPHSIEVVTFTPASVDTKSKTLTRETQASPVLEGSLESQTQEGLDAKVNTGATTEAQTEPAPENQTLHRLQTTSITKRSHHSATENVTALNRYHRFAKSFYPTAEEDNELTAKQNRSEVFIQTVLQLSTPAHPERRSTLPRGITTTSLPGIVTHSEPPTRVLPRTDKDVQTRQNPEIFPYQTTYMYVKSTRVPSEPGLATVCDENSQMPHKTLTQKQEEFSTEYQSAAATTFTPAVENETEVTTHDLKEVSTHDLKEVTTHDLKEVTTQTPAVLSEQSLGYRTRKVVPTEVQPDPAMGVQAELSTPSQTVMRTEAELVSKIRSGLATETRPDLTTSTYYDLVPTLMTEMETMNINDFDRQTEHGWVTKKKLDLLTQPSFISDSTPDQSTQTQSNLIETFTPDLASQNRPNLITRGMSEAFSPSQPEILTVSTSDFTAKNKSDSLIPIHAVLSTQSQPQLDTSSESGTESRSELITQTSSDVASNSQTRVAAKTTAVHSDVEPSNKTKMETSTQSQLEAFTQPRPSVRAKPDLTTEGQLEPREQPGMTTQKNLKQPRGDSETQNEQTTQTQEYQSPKTHSELSTWVWPVSGQNMMEDDNTHNPLNHETETQMAERNFMTETTDVSGRLFPPSATEASSQRQHKTTLNPSQSVTQQTVETSFIPRLRDSTAAEGSRRLAPTAVGLTEKSTERIYTEAPRKFWSPSSPPRPANSTPQTFSEMMSVRPGRERIFIVDEQQPVFKVQTINVTYRMNLKGAAPMHCQHSETCRPLILKEVTSFYKSVPGFDGIELPNITWDASLIEYRLHLKVQAGDVMSETQELVLSDPTWLFESSQVADGVLSARLRGVSLADKRMNPCRDWFSCPVGFECASVRKVSARCLSPCHGHFCHNHGICIHRDGQDPECQCPVGRDFWYMGQTCDYRMTHHRLAAIACGVVFCIIVCAAAAVFIIVRRFQTHILQQKVAQTQSSYRRFSRFDDVPTHFWCPSQTWLTTSASLNSLDNPAFSSSEEVFPLQALGSCMCGCQEGRQSGPPSSPPESSARDPPRTQTSCSSVNDIMIDSGKASDVSVSSWPMEPIHWTPFPILHQLSLQSPFHARRPHSYFEGMELVNTERSWTA